VLGVAGGCVDSGYLPDRVFQFTNPRKRRNIYATKGKAQYSGPLYTFSEAQFKNKKVAQLAINTDSAKETVYTRLNKIHEPGPGYCHFPKSYEQEYFKKLTNEEKREKKVQGQVVGHSWFKLGANEPLDCRVGAWVAISKLNPNLAAKQREFSKVTEHIKLNIPPPAVRSGRRVRSPGL